MTDPTLKLFSEQDNSDSERAYDRPLTIVSAFCCKAKIPFADIIVLPFKDSRVANLYVPPDVHDAPRYDVGVDGRRNAHPQLPYGAFGIDAGRVSRLAHHNSHFCSSKSKSTIC